MYRRLRLESNKVRIRIRIRIEAYVAPLEPFFFCVFLALGSKRHVKRAKKNHCDLF